jgi:adenylate cyclase
MKKGKKRRLAAIMFTDIVGYTALMQKDEAIAISIRAKHRKVFEHTHSNHHGEILQYFGDGTLSVFQSGVEAVECAIAIQLALHEDPVVPLRIGLHLGDIVFDGTDILGDGVNLASRIESMGVAGSILLSGKLNDELKNHPHIKTQSLGVFGLKNIEQAVKVFAVDHPSIKVPVRADLKGKQVPLNKSIAVLPFVNMSTSEENEYFADGMTEEIINALTKVKGLKVTSRTSSFYFKNKNIPVTQIGNQLSVSTVLEGSIRLSGNKMRLTAQLIDVVEDFHFWSATFDRSLEDIFAVQDEISLLIADKLREHIGHFDIEEHLVDSPNVSVDAYKDYLKGRFLLLKMGKADIEEGLVILEKILKQQPNFTLAHIGMHLAYTLLGTLGLAAAGEAFAKAQPHLEKAIKLNSDLPEIQLHLSYITLLQDWNFPATYKHIQKAMDIRPTVECYQSMASALGAERKFSAALNYIETALQLDPFSHINYHLKGFIYYGQGKYATAIECFEKSIELQPYAKVSQMYLGQAWILNGEAQKSLAFFEQLPPGDPELDLVKLEGTTLTYATMGELALARPGIEQLENALKTELMGRAINTLMLIYTVLGEHEKALQLIEKGITLRLPLFIYLYSEPILSPLYEDERFQAYIAQILGDGSTLNFTPSKYKKTLLKKPLQQKYKQQLTSLMDNEKPYLDPDLSLRNLADMMEIPPNQLSQLLNEGFDQNFSEYINNYRLEAFKEKAADPDYQHLTILALAYDSGFNSKTVFNTFFKKVMGMTPSKYWKTLK